jgi:signal peptidase I
VPSGHDFVLGDHRNNSLDSRDASVGVVGDDDMIWSVRSRLLVENRATALARSSNDCVRDDAEARLLRHRVSIPSLLAAAFTLFALSQSFQWPRSSIASGSMDPTLEIGNAIAARFWSRPRAARGDLVVFRDRDRSIDYVKRIIGLPDDHMQLWDGTIVINGTAVPMEPEETMPEVIVPRSYYYVLGDNRDNSLDSRYGGLGFVKRDDLVGRPRLVLLSHSPRRIFPSHD